jgi:putative N6-adenine-specific DNA methylase
VTRRCARTWRRPLRTSGWKPGVPLFDPMCGSGTILAEAAQMIAGVPPGARRRFAFEKFSNFDADAWFAIKGDFKPNPIPTTPTLFGSDISGDMVELTRKNLVRAGVHFECRSSRSRRRKSSRRSMPMASRWRHHPLQPALRRAYRRARRPRLPTEELFTQFFSAFSSTLKQRFAGWSVFLFSADLGLPKLMRLKESRKTPFFNGALECRLFRFDMVAGYNRREEAKPHSRDSED